MAALTRRLFLAASAGGAALGASGAAAAAASPAPSLRPGPAAPVRALHNDVPYFDFTGVTPAYTPTRAPALDESTLTAEQLWLLGLL